LKHPSQQETGEEENHSIGREGRLRHFVFDGCSDGLIILGAILLFIIGALGGSQLFHLLFNAISYGIIVFLAWACIRAPTYIPNSTTWGWKALAPALTLAVIFVACIIYDTRHGFTQGRIVAAVIYFELLTLFSVVFVVSRRR
jgi:hypothetical protein